MGLVQRLPRERVLRLGHARFSPRASLPSTHFQYVSVRALTPSSAANSAHVSPLSRHRSTRFAHSSRPTGDRARVSMCATLPHVALPRHDAVGRTDTLEQTEQTAASSITKRRCHRQRAAAAQRAVSLTRRLDDWRLRATRLGPLPRGPQFAARVLLEEQLPLILRHHEHKYRCHLRPMGKRLDIVFRLLTATLSKFRPPLARVLIGVPVRKRLFDVFPSREIDIATQNRNR
jgi:hypothetical protein